MCVVHLFKSVQHFLSLAEVPEEQLQGSRHQGGVVVHGEVDQYAQEHTTTFIIHFQDTVPFAAQTHPEHTHTDSLLISDSKS